LWLSLPQCLLLDSTTGSQNKEISSTSIIITHHKRLVSKSRGKTCAFCSKKLTLIGEMKCACGGTFCAKHQFSKDHNCVYDYRSNESKKIEKSNPKVAGEKITKF
uniref:AN1-type domain-containing protein n=1 Tax=Rodentolepis nana TaxID=102285 RepID=A0A0R3T4B2_RODNA